MKSYIVYDNDGVIIRTGVCPDSDISLQGNNVIEGVCTDDVNYKVIDGELVYSPVLPTVEDTQKKIRKERNIRLSQSDWTQMPDAPLSSEQKQQWATYRQQLRDLPSLYPTETNIDNVVFPEIP